MIEFFPNILNFEKLTLADDQLLFESNGPYQVFAISWMFSLQIVLTSNLLPHHLFRYLTIVKPATIGKKISKIAVIVYGLNILLVLASVFICFKHVVKEFDPSKHIIHLDVLVKVPILWLLVYFTAIIALTFFTGISTIRQLYSECLTKKTKYLRRQLMGMLLVQAS